MADNEDEVIVARVESDSGISIGKVVLLVVAFILLLGGMLYAVIETSRGSDRSRGAAYPDSVKRSYGMIIIGARNTAH